MVALRENVVTIRIFGYTVYLIYGYHNIILENTFFSISCQAELRKKIFLSPTRLEFERVNA